MEKRTLGAAAAAGMSERSGRRWKRGPLPTETKKPRDWRTRPDPFATVWQSEVVPLLEADEHRVLEAGTILGELDRRHPGEYGEPQRRTLQRRIRDWRAVHGPEREIFFEQEHIPGREAAFDFTHATELGVTIVGQLLEHLFFVLTLSFSGWTWIALAFGETFEALVAGLQGALWELGAVPAVARHDNLSAATHELKESAGRKLTRRWAAVLDHYDLKSTRINAGEAHENGVAEKSNGDVKKAIAQALVLRGSRDFGSVEDYVAFARDVVDRSCNQPAAKKLAIEREKLRPLPCAPVPSYTTYYPTVRRWSTVRVNGRVYSVPSRLLGHEVEVRQHADVLEVLYRDQLIETMPRLRGSADHRVDYRHVIWSLVRKPGAFARYKYREDLFPSLVFRRAYDVLCASRGDRADVEYVRVLHLAASTLECDVESHVACAIGHALVEQGHAVLFAPTYQLVQELLAAKRDLALPSMLRKLDAFDAIVLDDIGYVQQNVDEAEVLFTLLAERYERRSVIITSNLVFSEWERIFRNPLSTMAAIDRLVHHSVILEFDGPSVRAEEAKRRQRGDPEPAPRKPKHQEHQEA